MKKPNGVGIVGMGVALPETVRTNDWWPEDFRAAHTRPEDPLTPPEEADLEIDPEIARYAGPYRADPFGGVIERRVLEQDRVPSDLEALAGSRALERAGVRPSEVDLLMVYSLPPDYPTPLNHGLVAHKLGLRRDVVAVGVATGCAAFVTQLHMAALLVQNGAYRTALIIQSAVSSRILHPRQAVSASGGDAAVATVVRRVDESEGIVAHAQDTCGELHSAARVRHAGDPKIPWFRGDLHQSALSLQGGDQQVMKTVAAKAATFCRETCLRTLDAAGCTVAVVDFFAASQPTAWFGRACCDSLGIPHHRNADTFPHIGHVMAASAPLNLWIAYDRGMLQKGSRILLYSPGTGFIRAALLCVWSLD